jgi:hypothetical protein
MSIKWINLLALRSDNPLNPVWTLLQPIAPGAQGFPAEDTDFCRVFSGFVDTPEPHGFEAVCLAADEDEGAPVLRQVPSVTGLDAGAHLQLRFAQRFVLVFS